MPYGVNESVLGAPSEFAVKGPARVCFNQGGIDLVDHETSYLTYTGIHIATLQVRGPNGTYKVSESSIFRQPSDRGLAVEPKPIAYRIGSRYAVYGPSEFYDGALRLTIWVDGLRQRRAHQVLTRILPNVGDMSTCTRRFMYGFFFDDMAPKAKQ